MWYNINVIKRDDKLVKNIEKEKNMYNYFEVVVKSEKEFFASDFLKKVFGERFLDTDGLEIQSEYRGMVKSLYFCLEMDMDEYGEAYYERFDFEGRLESASEAFPDLEIFFSHLNNDLFCIGDECYKEFFVKNGELIEKRLTVLTPDWQDSEKNEVFKKMRNRMF